jgi:hypothetical protein
MGMGMAVQVFGVRRLIRSTPFLSFLGNEGGWFGDANLSSASIVIWFGFGFGYNLIFVLGATIPTLCFRRLNPRMILRSRVLLLK